MPGHSPASFHERQTRGRSEEGKEWGGEMGEHELELELELGGDEVEGFVVVKTEDIEKAGERKLSTSAGKEAVFSEQQMVDTARGEIVVKPTAMTIVKTMFRPQVLVLAF
ncbi:MAG: hypothetical protein M1823_008476, partial [Watsoniomyces obsoletus]